MAPAYGGIMPLTGKPEGLPMKVGVGIADVLCGMYASSGILTALRHEDMTAAGQHIDLALVDAHFKRLAEWIGKPDWADNPSFATNPAHLPI
jgi:crotonobetainyl-CoA:carnitine CoA-transferase CaiB-like acyl-CoA transferase